ncbi:SDR family NAD(P)-dependent oxidoreductase [Pseudonocardia sp. SID8383]|nr:SDR family NAD(P)-dependent oxidoreductase [Pseudonocardia sp. SID8383]
MVERPGPQLPPVAQAVLPHLRARGAGHIIQISTTGAVGAMPTLGLYNAGKWGLEGFSQALAGEVARFGVRVSVAQLGGFDTDWAGAGMHFATPSAVYDDLRPRALPDGRGAVAGRGAARRARRGGGRRPAPARPRTRRPVPAPGRGGRPRPGHRGAAGPVRGLRRGRPPPLAGSGRDALTHRGRPPAGRRRIVRPGPARPVDPARRSRRDAGAAPAPGGRDLAGRLSLA